MDIHHTAHLARIKLTPEEETRFAEQLTGILGYIDKLSELDLTGIEPSAHPIHGHLRPDQPAPSLSPQAFLQNAPDQSSGQLRVPKVVDVG